MPIPGTQLISSPPASDVPAALRPLGTLRTAAPAQAGRPSHVAAGSGIVAIGSHVHVIPDDELHLASFDADATQPGTFVRALPGELPLDPTARKHAKPDLEALVHLPPPPAGDAGGTLLAVPSGSKLQRHVGVAWSTGADGATSGAARPVDFAPLYDALRGLVRGKLNIEGAAVRGAELVLLHRGNSAHGVAAAVALDLATFRTGVRAGRIDAGAIRSVVEYDLGALDGVRLGFTDATPLPGGRIGFTAAAEVTDDPVHDGEVTGSVLGVLGPDGQVQQLRRLGGAGLKVEGLASVQSATGVVPGQDGRVTLLLVTDADDLREPSQLLTTTLELGR